MHAFVSDMILSFKTYDEKIDDDLDGTLSRSRLGLYMFGYASFDQIFSLDDKEMNVYPVDGEYFVEEMIKIAEAKCGDEQKTDLYNVLDDAIQHLKDLDSGDEHRKKKIIIVSNSENEVNGGQPQFCDDFEAKLDAESGIEVLMMNVPVKKATTQAESD